MITKTIYDKCTQLFGDLSLSVVRKVWTKLPNGYKEKLIASSSFSVTQKAEEIQLEEYINLEDHVDIGLTLNIIPVGSKVSLKFILSEGYSSAPKFLAAKVALKEFLDICTS